VLWEEKRPCSRLPRTADKRYSCIWQVHHFIDPARKALSDWVTAAQNSNLPKFISCGNTTVRWYKGILNSFDCPYTNGFPEGANNKIKVLKRNAHGCRNFRRFRNRILLMFTNLAQIGAA